MSRYRPKIRERLADLLETHGFAQVNLRPAQGAWRTDRRLDVYRWEGQGVAHNHQSLPDGFGVTFASWERMTDCLHHGIIVGRGDSGLTSDFLVHAKAKG
jgi:hypothetical protein